MSKISGMVARLIQAQDAVTHMNEKGSGFAADTMILIRERNALCAEVQAYVGKLERNAHTAVSVLAQAADNPSNDIENRSIYRGTADLLLEALTD